MAEVTGDLGGQPIQLNNAATEATLKQLLQAMLASVAMQNKGTKADNKTQKDLEAQLRKLAKTASDADKAQNAQIAGIKKLTEAQKKQAEQAEAEREAKAKAKKLYDEETKSLEKNLATLDKWTGRLEDSIGYLTKTIGTFSNLNSSMSSAAQAMGAIPLVGNMLASTFGVIAQAGERTYKAFQQASSVGANFGGSINDMINSATSAGMTFDQFAGVLAKNGESLAMLAQGAGDGAKRLAELGAKIRTNPLNADLARLGYTTEDINNGMAKYVSILGKTGKLQGQTDAQLIAGSGEYLKNLDALSKLTGKSKDALQAEQDALMNDAAYRTKLAEMDPKGAAELNKLMLSLPPSMQKGMKEYIAFGGATTDAGREFATFMQKSAGNANQIFQEINATGTVSQKTINDAYSTIRNEANEFKKTGTAKLLANTGNSIQQQLVLDSHNLSAQAGNLTDVQKKQADDLEAARKRAEAGKEALDPAQLQRFQQLIAEINNRITQTVAKYLPDLEAAFKKLAGFVEQWVLPGFEFLMKYLKETVVILGGLKIASALFNAALKIREWKANLRGSSPANAMYVRDAGGGGGGGRRRRRKSGPKGGKGGTGRKPKGGKSAAAQVAADAAGVGGGAVGTAIDVATSATIFGALAYATGTVTDSLMDAAGASREVTEDMAKQDEANWKAASWWEKAQSGLARSVESVGSFIGLDKLAERAKHDRILAETEYLKKKNAAGGTAPTTTAPTTTASTTTTSSAGSLSALADQKDLSAIADAHKQELALAEQKQEQLKKDLNAQLSAIAAAKAKAAADRDSAEAAAALADAEKKKAEIEARLAANSKKVQEGLTTTTKALDDAKKAELDAAKKAEEAKAAEEAAKKKGLDFSSPQALYNSFKAVREGGAGAPQVAAPSGTTSGSAPVAEIPGASAIGTGLGAVAEKYESAGRGSGTVGWDKVGGTSYGKKQISSRAGAMTDFLKFLEKTGKGDVAKKLRDAGIEKDTGSTSGKAVDVWKEVAASGALGNSENEFLGQGYGTALKGLKDQGLQARINGSRALQEMLFSTAVQHGPGGAMKIFNSVFKPGMTDEQLVKAVYAERGADGGKKHFGGSTANVQAGVVNRFGKEQQDILGLLAGGSAPVTPSGTSVASAVTPTATAATTAAASSVASASAPTTQSPPVVPGSGAPGAGGISSLNEAVALLERLNMQMGTLISISRTAVDLNESQLRVQRTMGGDMFMSS
jgi:chemotaxis protein histidine kinase CheA